MNISVDLLWLTTTADHCYYYKLQPISRMTKIQRSTRIALDLLVEDKPVLSKAEHRFLTVDPHICYTSGKLQIHTNYFNPHSNVCALA
jgi:hypothetical protein